jgi:BCD family chlorophyll transporter-like MFS transporter
MIAATVPIGKGVHMASRQDSVFASLFASVKDTHSEIAEWLALRPALQWWARVLRLGLFQFGIGISLAPITGTLNRVLINELSLSAGYVALLMAIHYFISPIRTVIGHSSDTQRSVGRWRTPYILLGAMLTFGGLTTAPFSLILFSPESNLQGPIVYVICVIIFAVYGVGVNIVETTYVAMVGDITEDHDRGKTLAILWLMLVIGTVVGALVAGLMLTDYSHRRLIGVMQGSSVVFMICAVISVIGQEKMNPDGTLVNKPPQRIRFALGESLQKVWQSPTLRSLFFIFFVATLGFGTHDILLEPYGAEILGMSVTATTLLTALWGVAMIFAIVFAGIWLWRGGSGARLLIFGGIAGIIGFACVSMSAYVNLFGSFQFGVMCIGVGRGLFIVGSIATVMSLADRNHTGLFIGIWGVVQSLAQGFGTIGGGVARDVIKHQYNNPLLGYVGVYAVAGGLLVIMVIYMAVTHIGRKLESGQITSPWGGLQDIPADQIIY